MEYKLLIKEFRELRGMTQGELAIRCNINQSYISQLENNHPKAKSPTLKSMFKIAVALGICPHVLTKYNIPFCNNNCLNHCLLYKKFLYHMTS